MKLLSIKNLNIQNDSQILFSNFNLDIDTNNIIGICAQTGSGKSTLLKYLYSIIKKDTSIVTNFKIDSKVQINNQIKLSYVFQEPRLLEYLSVYTNLELINKNSKEIEQVLSDFNLLEKKNSLVKNLSGGQKQRLSVARALLIKSNLLFLDEPFVFQDKVNYKKMIENVKNYINTNKCAVIIVSHNNDELKEICNIIINQNDFCL